MAVAGPVFNGRLVPPLNVMKLRRGTVLAEMFVLPHYGCKPEDEVDRAKFYLRAAGISIVRYELADDHAVLAVDALDCDLAIDVLTRCGLNVSRPN
jgi:hypothetical protein